MAEDLLKRVEILLEANTAKFETGMAKAERIVKDSAKTMSKGFESVSDEVKGTQKQVDALSQAFEKHDAEVRNIAKSYDVANLAVKGLSALAAGVSIGSLTAYAQSYIEQGNEIQKLSSLIGTSAQQFQYYAAGANVAGVNLDKFAQINKDALDKLGDAMAGQGEMMDFFEQVAPKIGVTIDQFKELSGPEVIQKYFNGLREANLSHAETIKFMEQIADDGSLLIPLLENGGEKFKEWGDAAQQAGAILSDSMLDNLKETKENVALLSLEWQGFQASVINNVTPVLTLLKENTDNVKAAAVGLGAYVGTQLVFALGRATIAGVAKTQQLAEQAAIQMTAIQMEKQAAAQDLVRAQTQVTNAQATLAALSAERALELQRLKSQISAQGLAASQTRLAEISLVEAQVKKELAVANGALAASQDRVTASQAAGMTVGRGLLGLLGGPIGLGLTVAGVAASYMLLKDNTADVSEILDIQGQSVEQLRDKWQELNAIQRDSLAMDLGEKLDKLREKYVFSIADLSSYIEHLENSGRVSEKVARQLNDQYKEYSAGRITADQFYQSVKAINGVSAEQVVKIRELITANQNSKQAYEDVKRKRDALVNSTPDAVAAHNAEKEAIKQKNAELQKTKELQNKANAENLKNQFWINTVKANGSNQFAVDYANFMVQWFEENKISFSDNLTAAQKKIAEEQFSLTRKRKDLETSITESTKAQTKETEKQLKAAEKLREYQIESTVKQYAQKYDFAGLERSIGAPDGLLSAIMSKESNGRTYDSKGRILTSPVGAQGSMQFMPATAKRFGVDVTSVQSSVQGATKYLQYLYNRFGDWDKAIAAYNAGEGNVQKHGGIPPFKETQNYVRIVKGKMATYNGISPALDGSSFDPIKEFERIEKEREQLRKQYQDRDLAAETEHKEKLAALTSKFAGSERDALISAENERFTNTQALNKAQLEYDLNAFKMTESEKLEAQKNIQVLRIRASVEYSNEEKNLRIQSIEKQFDKELADYRDLQWQKLQEYEKTFADMNARSQDMIASATMTPAQYKQYSLSEGVNRDLSYSFRDESEIIRKIGKDDSLNDDQKRQQMLDAEKAYRDQRYAIIASATKAEADLANDLHTEQLNIYASLLSQASTVWGSMTEMVKQSAGESSAAYKTMFLMQQAIAIGQAIISTELAATKALELGPIFGIPAVSLVRAMGYASVGLIAAQTISGIAHGGMDYVPSESTYLLDKGERVVSPKQNKDLTTFLENQGSSSSGNVSISQNITFTGSGANIDTQGQKEIAQSLNNAMDAWARRESRQGGLLHKLARG